MSASMTVEAALSLPMFLLLWTALMQPIEWLDRQRQIQTMMENTCEELSQYAYVEKERNRSLGEKNSEEEEIQKMQEEMETTDWYRVISEAAGGLWLRRKVNAQADHIEVIKAEAVSEKENLLLLVEYRENVPFLNSVINKTVIHTAVKRRMWTGLDGKLKESETDHEKSKENGESDWVYVGAGMGRYHLYRDCHYISNQYEEIAISQAVQMRNSYGVKLTACSRCQNSGNQQDIVYITKEGEHYHYSKTCSAMVAYVRKVQKKEVEHLGICSYCLRRRQEEERK